MVGRTFIFTLSQLDGEFCQPFALCEGDVVFFGGQDGFAVVSGDVGCAVGSAAALGAAEGGFGVGDAADDHAVVQEGEHHGEEGGFLSAVLGGGAGEDGGGFAGKFCAEPQGMVPSMKYFMAAAMLPKRVGLPRARAAQVLRSSAVA